MNFLVDSHRSFYTWSIRTIVIIFVVIFLTFRQVHPSAYLRCFMSNSRIHHRSYSCIGSKLLWFRTLKDLSQPTLLSLCFFFYSQLTNPVNITHCSSLGTLSVTVIFIGSRINQPSSIPGQCCLHFIIANGLGKSISLSVLPTPSYE